MELKTYLILDENGEMEDVLYNVTDEEKKAFQAKNPRKQLAEPLDSEVLIFDEDEFDEDVEEPYDYR